MESFGLEFDIVATAHVNGSDCMGGLDPIFHREASADLCESCKKVSADLGDLGKDGRETLEVSADEKALDVLPPQSCGDACGIPRSKSVLWPELCIVVGEGKG
jgi:hypothetical protein